MSRPRTRRLAVVVAAASVLAAAAAPALAQTSGVDVSLQDSPGSRQFAVQDISGNPLTAVNLGTGGLQPFRTQVTDSAFKNVTSGYQVNAKMNNLYLQQEGGSDYTTKVPSSDVSLQYGTSPLSALGVEFPVLPKLGLGGLLTDCAGLPDSVKTVLGLPLVGDVLLGVTDPALLDLCDALAAANNKTVTGTVDSAVQQITSDLTRTLDLTQLPTQLTGATPGAFTNPDYSDGTIGAGDSAKAGAPAATTLGIMTGTPGMVSALQDVVTTKVNGAIGSLPLTDDATDPAKTTVGAVLAELGGSTDAAVANVSTALGALDAVKQSAVLNTLTGTLLPPQVSDLVNVSGQYYGFPILKATPSTPVAGTYKGTMTVTFIQQ